MFKSHKTHNSFIKVKVGKCSLCDNNIESPLIKGLCRNHYWQSKRKPIEKEEVRPIRKVAPKRAKQIAKYLKVRFEYLNDNPFCKVCGNSATECHHIRGKISELLHDKNNLLAVCRSCHHQIELNPDWAKERGYSANRL